MNAAIRVMIVEDHALVRTGLRTALRAAGFNVVGEAADGVTAEGVAEREHPDVAVVDLGLPGRDGADLVRRFGTLEHGPRCVVLTTRTDENSIRKSIEAGAFGYCSKSSAEDGLLDAIRAAARGAYYLDPEAATVMRRNAVAKGSQGNSPLTTRETEILSCIAGGAGNSDIANDLHISLATVKTYVAEILRKLEATDRAHAVALGVRRGLIS
jgi:DNA-binding NarL/FixJ family response regulator